MHERTLVPFLVSPVEFFEAHQFFHILLVVTLVFCSQTASRVRILDFCVAATAATVSVSSLSLLNFETSPVIYPILQVDF